MKTETIQKYYSSEKVMLLDIAFMCSDEWEILTQEKYGNDYRVVYERRKIHV